MVSPTARPWQREIISNGPKATQPTETWFTCQRKNKFFLGVYQENIGFIKYIIEVTQYSVWLWRDHRDKEADLGVCYSNKAKNEWRNHISLCIGNTDDRSQMLLWGFLFRFVLFGLFLGPHPQHMEVPRRGVRLEL